MYTPAVIRIRVNTTEKGCLDAKTGKGRDSLGKGPRGSWISSGQGLKGQLQARRATRAIANRTSKKYSLLLSYFFPELAQFTVNTHMYIHTNTDKQCRYSNMCVYSISEKTQQQILKSVRGSFCMILPAPIRLLKAHSHLM
jgi:hypothetical protein